MDILVKKVTYQGGFVTNESMKKILALLEEKGIKLLSRVIEDNHITITYFDDKAIKIEGKDPVTVRKEFLIPNEDLGRIVKVRAIAYGEYVKDGIVMNQGLEITMDSLKEVVLSDGRTLADIFGGIKPHITLALSDKKDVDNKFIAKAVDTYLCDFKGEKSKVFEMEIEVTLEVCKFNVRGTNVIYD
jgi:hypothetical protein